MAERSQLELLTKGPERWNEWRRLHPDHKPDLRNAYLCEFDFSEFDLRGVDFRGSVLMAAKFGAADLRGASLGDCDLRFADLRGARIRGANFDGAQGVERSIVRAAGGASALWRRRPGARLPLSILLFTLIAAAGYLGASAGAGFKLPGLGAANELTTDSNAGLDDAERLARKLRGVRFPGWDLASVDVDEDVLTMRVDRGSISDDVYLPAIGAICGGLLENRGAGVSEVRVLDRTGRTGWVYSKPANCAVLLQSPVAMMRLLIAADSRPVIGFEDGR